MYPIEICMKIFKGYVKNPYGCTKQNNFFMSKIFLMKGGQLLYKGELNIMLITMTTQLSNMLTTYFQDTYLLSMRKMMLMKSVLHGVITMKEYGKTL